MRLPFLLFMFACAQVFQTEYNQVIDVSQCPVPYIRHESPCRVFDATCSDALSDTVLKVTACSTMRDLRCYRLSS